MIPRERTNTPAGYTLAPRQYPTSRSVSWRKMERSSDGRQQFEHGMSVINPEQKTCFSSARLAGAIQLSGAVVEYVKGLVALHLMERAS